LEAFSMDRIERVFDTNVIGVMATMKAVIPGMRKRRAGTIINVSSVGGPSRTEPPPPLLLKA
jgi:NADP-dependent 3-hydroxy acid dehydrogenase YdfG